MKNNFKGFYLVSFAVLALIFYISAKYFNFFETNPPLTREEWGQLGDYFGGTLNPILGFASFLALLATIVYQVKELNLSRTELELTRQELSKSAAALASQNKAIELQSFEQTFFSWLNTYRDLLNAVSGSLSPKAPITQGRTHLYDLWYKSLSPESISDGIFKRNDYDGQQDEINESLNLNTNLTESVRGVGYAKRVELVAQVNPIEITERIQSHWKSLYINNEYKLDSFFRTAYKLLTWIDSQDTSRLSANDKWLYVSIFRSQLSWIEMVYFYYNGLTSFGEKFKPIIEKYALFDNLTFDSDIGIKTVKKHLIPQKFYLAPAFSSELAREKLGLPKSSEETQSLATTTSQVL